MSGEEVVGGGFPWGMAISIGADIIISVGLAMQKAGHKQQMAADIWTADFAGSMEGVRAANPEIVRVLEAQTANSTRWRRCA